MQTRLLRKAQCIPVCSRRQFRGLGGRDINNHFALGLVTYHRGRSSSATPHRLDDRHRRGLVRVAQRLVPGAIHHRAVARRCPEQALAQSGRGESGVMSCNLTVAGRHARGSDRRQGHARRLYAAGDLARVRGQRSGKGCKTWVFILRRPRRKSMKKTCVLTSRFSRVSPVSRGLSPSNARDRRKKGKKGTKGAMLEFPTQAADHQKLPHPPASAKHFH